MADRCRPGPDMKTHVTAAHVVEGDGDAIKRRTHQVAAQGKTVPFHHPFDGERAGHRRDTGAGVDPGAVGAFGMHVGIARGGVHRRPERCMRGAHRRDSNQLSGHVLGYQVLGHTGGFIEAVVKERPTCHDPPAIGGEIGSVGHRQCVLN